MGNADQLSKQTRHSSPSQYRYRVKVVFGICIFRPPYAFCRISADFDAILQTPARWICIYSRPETHSLPRAINFKFPPQHHQKYNITQFKNMAFHSLLRSQMIILPILTTSLTHFSLEGWENVLFERGSERTCPLDPRRLPVGPKKCSKACFWSRVGIKRSVYNSGVTRINLLFSP